MQIVPWRNLPNWQQEIVMDGIVYHLSFHWNSLNEFWSMDIYDRDQNPIILGIKLVVNYDVTSHYINENLFPGTLLVIDFSREVEVIGREDMGDRVQLIYQERQNAV